MTPGEVELRARVEALELVVADLVARLAAAPPPEPAPVARLRAFRERLAEKKGATE